VTEDPTNTLPIERGATPSEDSPARRPPDEGRRSPSRTTPGTCSPSRRVRSRPGPPSPPNLPAQAFTHGRHSRPHFRARPDQLSRGVAPGIPCRRVSGATGGGRSRPTAARPRPPAPHQPPRARPSTWSGSSARSPTASRVERTHHEEIWMSSCCAETPYPTTGTGHTLTPAPARARSTRAALRQQLLDGLTEVWNEALAERRKMAPNAPIATLNELLSVAG
jgi:hypothetical protein